MNAIQNPYLQGNFGPVDGELTSTDLKVTGEIPAELNGRLLASALTLSMPILPITTGSSVMAWLTV